MITPLQAGDEAEWLRMRRTLWPDCPEEIHRLEVEEQRSSGAAVFVFRRDGGGLGGFIELSIRERVDGSLSPRVGYVEGWFVDEDLRGKGVGRRLIAHAEDWTRSQGLTEIASDAEIDNPASIEAHAALGFSETFRLAHFLKRI